MYGKGLPKFKTVTPFDTGKQYETFIGEKMDQISLIINSVVYFEIYVNYWVLALFFIVLLRGSLAKRT